MSNSTFLITSQYLKPLEEVDSKRDDHLAYMNNYVLAGIFVLAGRKHTNDGAVVIAANTTKEEIELILSNDPYVLNGLAKYDIIEFKIGMSGLGVEEVINNLRK